MAAFEYRTRIDEIELLILEDELWFLQGNRVSWITKLEAMHSPDKVAEALMKAGYTLDLEQFAKKLRDLLSGLTGPREITGQ